MCSFFRLCLRAWSPPPPLGRQDSRQFFYWGVVVVGVVVVVVVVVVVLRVYIPVTCYLVSNALYVSITLHDL